MVKWIKILLIFLVILINVFIAYQLHFDYKYPALGDEYAHISFAKYIIEEKSLPFINPYLSTIQPHKNFESGFHFFLVGIFSVISLADVDPIIFYKYLIIIFMIINSLLLFWLVMLWYKDYLAALVSMIFFGSIKSLGGFLSHQYFIPLTLGITLLFLSLIFLYKSIMSKSKKDILYLIGILILMAFVYPPSLFFFFGILFVYLLFIENSINEIFHLNKKRFLIYFLSLSIGLFTLFILILKFLGLFNNVIFPIGWSAFQLNLSPIFFFGLIPTIFAIAGIFSIISLKKSKIMLSWFIFSIIMIYFFYLFNFVFFIPFQRLFFIYLVGISILAGLGFSFVINKLSKIRRKEGIKNIIIVILILLITFHVFSSYNIYSQQVEILNDEKYEALKFLEENYPNKSVIITDSLTSLAVYPVSGHYVSGLIDSNIGGGNVKESNKFFSGNCADKREAISKIFQNVSRESHLVIVSEEKLQECGFYSEIYNKKPYMYSASLSGRLKISISNMRSCEDCKFSQRNKEIPEEANSKKSYDIIFNETGGLTGINLKNFQTCSNLTRKDNSVYSRCNDLMEIKTYIPPGGSLIIKSVIWKLPIVISKQATETYFGVDDAGNEIKESYSISIS